MAASYDFVQLDVFTLTPLAGNPLAHLKHFLKDVSLNFVHPKRNYDSRRQT
jgi:hypothetical protein